MSVFSPTRIARSVLGLVSPHQMPELDTTDTDSSEEDEHMETEMEATKVQQQGQTQMNNHFDALNPLEILPPELFENVTKYLSVGDLKNCRLVARDWPKQIQHEMVRRTRLSANLYHALKCKQLSTALANDWNQNGFPLKHNTFRISGFMCARDPLDSHFNQWLNRENMKTVRCLELPDSQFSVVQLIRVLSAFDNLDVLEFGTDSILGRGWNIQMEQDMARRTDNYFMEVGKIVMSRLKVLRVKCSDPCEFFLSLNLFGAVNFLRLYELEVNGSCGSPNFKLGMLFARLFLNNCETLKVLKLDCDSRRGLLDSALADQDNIARQELPVEFRSFLTAMDSSKWSICGLDLTELSLQRFGVAEMSDERVERVFYPFLRSLTNLKKFEFSQAFFFGDELTGVERLINQLPLKCRVNLVTTHVFANHASPTCFEEMLDYHKNISKYKDTFMEVEFGNLLWTILYCTWNSLNHPIMEKYGRFLAKFKMNEAKFPIGDNEVQFLISECPKLKELHLDLCDMSGLTDCGLTGLSRRAVAGAHMTLHRYVFELIPTDYIGLPMHSMTDLRSLTLGNIGEKISNLSIALVFMNFPRLQKLLIRQFPMTLSPTALKKLHDVKNIDLDYVHVPRPNAGVHIGEYNNQY